MSTTDLFTCDIGHVSCAPYSSTESILRQGPGGVGAGLWTDITTAFGDGFTTSEVGDIIGVAFTGVEGYYTGLVGPYAGTYGCSFDGGKTYTSYSAYQFDHSYQKLCAWKGLPMTHDPAYIINYSSNLTLLEFVYSTNGENPNLAWDWYPESLDQATSNYIEAAAAATGSTVTAKPSSGATSNSTPTNDNTTPSSVPTTDPSKATGNSTPTTVPLSTPIVFGGGGTTIIVPNTAISSVTSTVFSTTQVTTQLSGATVTVTSSLSTTLTATVSAAASTSSTSTSSNTTYIIIGVVVVVVILVGFLLMSSTTSGNQDDQENRRRSLASSKKRPRREMVDDEFMNENKGLVHSDLSDTETESEEESEGPTESEYERRAREAFLS